MFAPKKSSTPKRKPFVSTTKRVATFGPPPPLPPVSGIAKEEPEEHHDNIEPAVMTETAEESHTFANLSSLQHQSIRWINLSITLWSIIVAGSNRQVDRKSLVNFLTALGWRLNGLITEDEFHCLYLEWIGKRSNSKAQKCSVSVLRVCLLDDSISEDSLDIFLGMLIFEVNKKLLNSPLSFHSLQSSNLEVCSSRWLALTEELFFQLDTFGYGYIGFDEFYFLASCLVAKNRNWKDEGSAEFQLSVPYITALTVCLLREAGANISLNTDWRLSKVKHSYREGSRPLLRRSITYNENGRRVVSDQKDLDVSPQPTEFKSPETCVVTLPMFKNLLISRSAGESSLVSLISLVRYFVDELIALSDEKGVDILLSACLLDNRDEVGVPKLWKTCVHTLSGYSASSELPMILLYLLSDGYVQSPLTFLAYPSSDIPHDPLWTTLGGQFSELLDIGVSPSDLKCDNETLLHQSSFHLWNSFLHWGEDYESSNELSESCMKDSVFQMISAILTEYKSSLCLLSAAIVDIALDTSNPKFSNLVVAGIDTLLPPPTEFLVPLIEICRDTSKFSNSEVIPPSHSITTPTIQPDSPIPVELGLSGPSVQLDSRSPNGLTPSEVGTNFENWLTIIGGLPPSQVSFWSYNTEQDISNSIWATIFDLKEYRFNNNYYGSPRETTPKSGFTSQADLPDRRRRRRRLRKEVPLIEEHRLSQEPVPLAQDSIDIEKPEESLEETLLPKKAQPISIPQNSIHESDSSLASSVLEMLERGQTAGQYAQSLRDLLRKMSSENTSLQLKSLEKIIELGNTIVESEEGQKCQYSPPSKRGSKAKISTIPNSIATPKSKPSTLLLGDDLIISAKKNVPGRIPKRSSTPVDSSQREQFELERQALRSRSSRSVSTNHGSNIQESNDCWDLSELTSDGNPESANDSRHSESKNKSSSLVPNFNNIMRNQSQSTPAWLAETFDDSKPGELEMFGGFFIPGTQTSTVMRNSKTSRLGSILGIPDSSDRCAPEATPEEVEVLDLDAVAIIGDLLDETSDIQSTYPEKQPPTDSILQKGLVRIPMSSLFNKSAIEKNVSRDRIDDDPLIIPESQVMKSLVISPTTNSEVSVASTTQISQEKNSINDPNNLLSRLVLASHHPVSDQQIQQPRFAFHHTLPSSSESSKINQQQKPGGKNMNISASSRLHLQKINPKSTQHGQPKSADEPNKMTKVDVSTLFVGKNMGQNNEKMKKEGTAGSRLLQQLKMKSVEGICEQKIRVISVTELIN